MNVVVVQPGEFSAACADAFRAAVGQYEAPTVGLATGGTPRAMYIALRRMAESKALDCSRLRPFAIDEYVCARDHRCSNRTYFREAWLTIPNAPAVTEFDPEAADLEAGAARVDAALEHAGGLDVAVLGAGMNGHLAFNEPGSARESRTRVQVLSSDSRVSAAACWNPDEPPSLGLTLGLDRLLGARMVLLLANGQHKADVARRVIRGPIGPDCPASYLREHPDVTVLLDTGAASFL